jgi:hypothetical protein
MIISPPLSLLLTSPVSHQIASAEQGNLVAPDRNAVDLPIR